MLMLAISATLHRMEMEAYSGNWTHVRENPVQHRHRPLSWLERLISDKFNRTVLDVYAATPIEIPAEALVTMPPCPVCSA